MDREKFQRLARPTNYMIVTVFISLYFILNLNSTSSTIKNIDGVDYFAIYGSILLAILISICYYIGYYYPKNSVKRGVSLLLGSVFILIDTFLLALTAIVEVKLDGIGFIIIDSTSLFIAPIILIICHVFKKLFDLYDFWKHKLDY